MDGRTDKWQLYFSTDDSMDGREVLDYYRTRFQLEFCFRDGKQHAGITNCQSTDFRKLDFHFNASLAAVNLAKAACKRLGIAYSISSCKSFIHNAYMLERFICVFGISPDPQVIDKLFKELILFTARTEIMAPVGSRESLAAAIHAGADSIYFGIGHRYVCPFCKYVY